MWISVSIILLSNSFVYLLLISLTFVFVHNVVPRADLPDTFLMELRTLSDRWLVLGLTPESYSPGAFLSFFPPLANTHLLTSFPHSPPSLPFLSYSPPLAHTPRSIHRPPNIRLPRPTPLFSPSNTSVLYSADEDHSCVSSCAW